MSGVGFSCPNFHANCKNLVEYMTNLQCFILYNVYVNVAIFDHDV